MIKITPLLIAILFCTEMIAQAPQKMSYQSVIRNASDILVSSTTVGIQISILQGTSSGTPVFVETHTPMTNANGLVSLEIGMGTPVTGTLAGIDWAAGPYFIKTETDLLGGTTYTISGTTELMSIPYALFSANGPVGPMGPAGPAGTNGTNGQGGVTQAGPEIKVTGAGSIADPYIVSSRTYTIGLWPELGGYVFRISADGRHGLVAETVNQSGSDWYSAQNYVSMPGYHSADGQKFMDWRLPTFWELNEMYNYKVQIGNFADYQYWSSSENLNNYAWNIDFLGGVSNVNDESEVYGVRSVRAF